MDTINKPMKMPRWISVDKRLPPDRWHGLILTDKRPDRPVMAGTADQWYRKEFPFAHHFTGHWRESLLVADLHQEAAVVTYWLETDELYPEPPNLWKEV